MMHTSIDTLWLWNFNKIKATDDLRYLHDDHTSVVIGLEHKAIWDNINLEYIDATSHRFENKRFADLKRSILQLNIKYNSVVNFIFILSKAWNDDAVDSLTKLGYRVKTKDDLLGVLNSVKNIKTQIREREMEMVNEFGKSEKPPSFEVILDRISDHKKRDIDPRKKTVKEWIAIEDNYLKDIKNASNKQKADIRR